MIALSHLRGKSVGVFGLGKAGDAAVAALIAGGAEVFAWDDGEASCSALAEKFGTGISVRHFENWPWERLCCVCLSPGVPYTHPAPHPIIPLSKQKNVEVLGDIELLFRECPKAKYVAITGTNGKSTTTTLIAHILTCAGRTIQVGGNLGTPVLAFEALDERGIYVIETSSYQLDLVRSTRFNVAVFLNITPDHLDRHGDMAGYVAAKMHIFDRQKAGDVAVVSVDDDYTQQIADSRWQVAGDVRLVRVSAARMEADITAMDGILRDCHLPSAICDLKSIPTLTGRHNWQNAAAAYAAAQACGVPHEIISEAMRSFAGLAHRLELIDIIRGVRFINDSKATNADATANALAPFQNIYWILGGKAKAGGIESLREFFPHIAHAFLIGEASDAFARTLEGQVNHSACGTLDVAVKRAAEMAFSEARDGAVVLLSPACASFDQFKNFEARGDAFRTLVKEYSHD